MIIALHISEVLSFQRVINIKIITEIFHIPFFMLHLWNLVSFSYTYSACLHGPAPFPVLSSHLWRVVIRSDSLVSGFKGHRDLIMSSSSGTGWRYVANSSSGCFIGSLNMGPLLLKYILSQLELQMPWWPGLSFMPSVIASCPFKSHLCT